MELEDNLCQNCGKTGINHGILITESNISGFSLNEPILYCMNCNSYSTDGRAFKNPQDMGDYILKKRIIDNFKLNLPRELVIKAKNARILGNITSS